MYIKSLEQLGYYEITQKLAECALTRKVKEQICEMEPMMSETALRKSQEQTTQARAMLELAGTPPLPSMEHVEEYLERAVRGEMLLAEHLEHLGLFLNAVRRLKGYLKKGVESQIGIAYYEENLNLPPELGDEIERCIRGKRVDDYASPYLRDVRRRIAAAEEKMAEKAEQALRGNKAFLSDSFVVTRNGRLCIPVRREYRGRVKGAVVDKSSTGNTLFMEPESVSGLREELEISRLEEDSEVRRILYTLTNTAAESEHLLMEDIRVIEKLDFIFAKGKLSLQMKAVEPRINLDGFIRIQKARHPMLEAKACIPLDFEIGREIRGVIITGPNTGGKTVAIKTVALMCAMACSGLHVPCEEADIAMRNQILCDIGDGQNIADNLSTFSAHIKNVLEILKRAGRESLVVLDELGSGTDPAEGMGIAAAILDELRKSQALFLVTTHYPEIKEYANRCPEVQNARMEFDRESLRPLYSLRVGEAGESCALYIAKQLGFPSGMLKTAAREAYGEKSKEVVASLKIETGEQKLKKVSAPCIRRAAKGVETLEIKQRFGRGDSVTVLPEKEIGIVVNPADERGNVLVQVKGEKLSVNQKRLKLKVLASQLYPEDYDFSIIFDTVENRKARHKMGKQHQEGLEIRIDSPG